jgi:hypothetical protein
VVFSESAVLPAADLERATAGLRGALRLTIAEATTELPDWTTLVVVGPNAVPGPGGRAWCRYTASVSTRPARI